MECKYKHISKNVNMEDFFFSFYGDDNKKRRPESLLLIIDLSQYSYFTTNLMVLLKPLALMVQK